MEKNGQEALFFAQKLCRFLNLHGLGAWIVGGAVRDLLLGKAPSDLDLAVEAEIGQIRDLCPDGVVVGAEGKQTLRLFREGMEFELTPFPQGGLVFELKRRDFTVNAIALDGEGNFVDPCGGIPDVASRTLRFNGNPTERLGEDPIRALRLVRFASTLPAFSLSLGSVEACVPFAEKVASCPKERIGKELFPSLTGEGPLFWDLLERARLTEAVLPALWALKGVRQDPLMHPEGDAYTHTHHCFLWACRLSGDPATRASSLLHDIGKAEVQTVREGRIHFYGHEELGAQKALEIMKRWAWPSDFSRDVASLIRFHMLPLLSPSPRAIARLLRTEGPLWLDRLFLLAYADLRAGSGLNEAWIANRTLAATALLKMKGKEGSNRPLLSGREIMETLGIKPGPKVGELLEELDEACLLGKIATREEALLWLESLREKGFEKKEGREHP